MKMARKSFGEDYSCQKDWPENSFVQCGGSGLVLGKEESYNTAFFEAFLLNTFLRGEGKTIELAEEEAFKKYENIKNCSNHEFERYKSGGSNVGRYGVCKHCNYKIDLVFVPESSCAECGKENVNFELDIIELNKGKRRSYCSKHFMEKAKTLNEDEWLTDEIKKIMSPDMLEKIENKDISINSDTTINYIKFTNYENITKKNIMDLYYSFFGADILKVKYPKGYMLGDEINNFIKKNSNVVNKKIFESIEAIKVSNNISFNLFSTIRIREKLRKYEKNLYRISFFVENKISEDMQEKIYSMNLIPFKNILEESKYIAIEINQCVMEENERIKQK